MADNPWVAPYFPGVLTQDQYNPVEGAFQRGIRDTPWFSEFKAKYGEEPNLNDPNYDYRAAWAAGARPDVRDSGDQMLHWSSQFKGPNHPNRFVNGVDTITGQRVDVPYYPGAFGTGSPSEMAGQPAGIQQVLEGLYNSLGSLAKRSFGASEEMRQGGAYNPAPAFEASMLPMGTGAFAGVPLRGGEAVLGAGPIRAYHGSPHDFERFDLSKIGTGEGAQAYGHGLYFAENEATAKAYREALSPGYEMRAGGKEYNSSDPAHLAAHHLDMFGKRGVPREEIAARLREDAHLGKRYSQAADLIDSGAPLPEFSRVPSGKMYEVNIKADPEHFLDWDKPLSQQSEKVNEALATILRDRERLPADWIKSSPGAESRMREAGIPGIKYLDQGSRTAGEGSRNYVVFDDSLIDILRKYGLAGMALPPVFAAANGKNQ